MEGRSVISFGFRRDSSWNTRAKTGIGSDKSPETVMEDAREQKLESKKRGKRLGVVK